MIKKNKLYIFIFFIIIIFLVLIYCHIPCFFKLLFKLPCPGCGLTRAFLEIFKLNITKAFYYNILSIPLFIFLLYMFTLLINDIINKSNNTFKKINTILAKHRKLIIVLLIISEFYNIYNK
ncbi:MAG: DUF2752 domain-containing protein [Bacilli bacterium]|nr:DUF2752 domain-containing protein [Bacilli bacterium]MBP3635539.1 DUF2752 domain-containing protein [Bacilli bacterium]